MKIISILILSLFFSVSQTKTQTGSLVIHVDNFNNNKGIARIALYSEENKQYFLVSLKYSSKTEELKITKNCADFVLNDIPYGKYSIIVHHDENNDGVVNRSFIGFPVEGYGISGNATTIGKPSFEDCEFEVNSQKKTLTIDMKYVL